MYVHVRCHATAAEDELYRAVLAEGLAAVRINLNWIEVPKLSTSRTSIIGRAARETKLDRGVFLAIGSHGCRSRRAPPKLLV